MKGLWAISILASILIVGFIPLNNAFALTETAKLTASDAAVNDQFGRSVAVSGDTVVVGARLNDDAGSFSGSAYVFGPAPSNQPPDCSGAAASPDSLWPPNHKFVDILVMNVTDSDADDVTISISAITQDEAVNGKGSGKTSPDGIIDGDTAQIRAERSGTGDGRVYEISFDADDGNGGTCDGTISVGVPHDKKDTAVDNGQIFDSTLS